MSIQNQDINVSNRGTVRNFLQQNIIGLKNQDKRVPKQLLQMIVPPSKRPIELLYQRNELADYIANKSPQLILQAKNLYQKVSDFKLLKFGQYIGNIQQSYIIFSQNLVALLKQGKNKWQGFCYRVSKSVYIGEFIDMKSEGRGKALFIQQYKDENKIMKKIYHIFQGNWKSGQITNGTRKTYEDYNQLVPLIQYHGDFANFQFHGQGVKKRNNKVVTGKFQKGSFVPIQTLQANNQQPIQAKQNNEKEQKNEKDKKSGQLI